MSPPWQMRLRSSHSETNLDYESTCESKQEPPFLFSYHTFTSQNRIHRVHLTEEALASLIGAFAGHFKNQVTVLQSKNTLLAL